MKPKNFEKIQELMRNRSSLADRLRIVEKESIIEEIEGQISDIDNELGEL